MSIISSSPSPFKRFTPILKRTWIKDPFDPNNNTQLPMETKWMQRRKMNRKEMFYPLGREKPIILSDRGRYQEFELTFVTIGNTLFKRVEKLIDLNRMLLVQTPKGQWYCEVLGEPTISENQFNLSEPTSRRVTIPFVETRDYDLA